MAATPRELVYQTLRRESPRRAPRQLWTLPWAELNHPDELAAIRADYPDDIVGAPPCLRSPARTEGDPYLPGQYRDEWGCVFENIQAGLIGEVKAPLIRDWATDVEKVRLPREWLAVDRDAANRFCAETDRFVHGACCPRPFEQLQFLRGTADLYMDLLAPPPAMEALMRAMHEIYCAQLEAWARTDVDALNFMDDWGAQDRLLVHPDLWRAIFRPLYRDYVQIAHGAGKKIFMHSDGHILAILPDLIELGVDAINAQLFCMGIDALAPFAGRITFWGEIDRQQLLPGPDAGAVADAVKAVHGVLWRDGGCIAQCEFGPAARPENVRAVFATWDALARERG